jgi:hypothetical protein
VLDCCLSQDQGSRALSIESQLGVDIPPYPALLDQAPKATDLACYIHKIIPGRKEGGDFHDCSYWMSLPMIVLCMEEEAYHLSQMRADQGLKMNNSDEVKLS